MDVISQLLSTSKKSAPSPDLLEALGKRAAGKYLKNKTPLSTAIHDLAKDHSNLDNEHIKRIAEFANNAVFQQMHASGEDKNVHFDVADPADIIRDLRDGGAPAHDGKTLNTGMSNKTKDSFVPSAGDGDYRRPPGDEATPESGGFDGFDSGMAELMSRDQSSGAAGQGESIDKVASLAVANPDGHANPVMDVYDAHLRLRASREKVAEAHERFDLLVKQAHQELYQSIKRELLDPDGPSLQDITNAVKLAAPSDSYAWRALRPVVEKLAQERVITSSSLEKTAGVRSKIVNPAHPIIRTFAGLVKSAQEKVVAREALRDLDAGIERTAAFLNGAR